MVTISAPLSAPQARTYYQQEYATAGQEYYSRGGEVSGHWHGRLAVEWGLVGTVSPDHYDRMANGQHPHTGVQLVQHQTTHTRTKANGQTVSTMEHRAGWDATFSAPKSLSITALVAGDGRIQAAHERAVKTAIDLGLEPSLQARIPGGARAVNTGKVAAVLFHHNSSRPVDGFSAPQVHTHVVLFNMTQDARGEVYSVQPRELFRAQSVATAVYQKSIDDQLTAMGYQLRRDAKTGAPEIVGYTPEYLKANSGIL